MVLGAAGGEGVAVLGGQLVGKGFGVGADLLGVLLELFCGNLLQLCGDAGNLVHVRSA